MFYTVAAAAMILITMLTLPENIWGICLVCVLGSHCLIRYCMKRFSTTTQSKSKLFGLFYFVFGALPCMVVVELGEKFGITVSIIIICVAAAGFNVVMQCCYK